MTLEPPPAPAPSDPVDPAKHPLIDGSGTLQQAKSQRLALGAKFGMSMCTLGMSAEFAGQGIAVNSLWPLTTIDTAAIRNLLGGEAVAEMSRSADIMADAAHAILVRPAREATGNFFIDEEVLRAEGVTDFSKYAPNATGPLAPDFFVPDEVFARSGTAVARRA